MYRHSPKGFFFRSSVSTVAPSGTVISPLPHRHTSGSLPAARPEKPDLRRGKVPVAQNQVDVIAVVSVPALDAVDVVERLAPPAPHGPHKAAPVPPHARKCVGQVVGRVGQLIGRRTPPHQGEHQLQPVHRRPAEGAVADGPDDLLLFPPAPPAGRPSSGCGRRYRHSLTSGPARCRMHVHFFGLDALSPLCLSISRHVQTGQM